jgi:hypothetical protein
MKKVICPFCKNSDNIKLCDSGFDRICMAHKNQVIILSEFLPSGYIRISYNNYLIYIHSKDKKMFIYYNNPGKINNVILYNVDLDPNLTPENIGEKIKTYLTFQ